MANKIVDDFEFDPGFGFSGSAGKQHVRGYVRGGPVKKGGCACGGEVHAMKKGGAAKKKATKRKPVSKHEAQMVEQLITQMAQQAATTGRVPGVPRQSRGVPVASSTPLIPMGGKTR